MWESHTLMVTTCVPVTKLVNQTIHPVHLLLSSIFDPMPGEAFVVVCFIIIMYHARDKAHSNSGQGLPV